MLVSDIKIQRRLPRTILSLVLAGVCASFFMMPAYAAENADSKAESEIIRFGDFWEEETGKHISIIIEKVVFDSGDIIVADFLN